MKKAAPRTVVAVFELVWSPAARLANVKTILTGSWGSIYHLAETSNYYTWNLPNSAKFQLYYKDNYTEPNEPWKD